MKARAAKVQESQFPLLSPAIKPGTYSEHLWNHPEEVDRILRENGVDLEELERILVQGGGKIPIGRLGRGPQAQCNPENA